MKQLIDLKFCLGCKDPCCEFSRKYSDLAPVFTDEEFKKIIAKGVPKEFFKKVGKSWQVVLVDNGGVYLDCPLVKNIEFLQPFEKNIRPLTNLSGRLYNKKTCGVQGNKPLMCRLFPFAVLEKDGKIILGVYQKGSACYALDKVSKEKKDEHIEFLKKYLRGMKEIFKKYPELVEKVQSDIKIICEL